ncbi:MAG: hypothetical protein ABIJ26_02860 [Candidatus Margulisiibacteriota bacterium]|nr:hypothetical protein [Candidatus Margulisiibacteriota bacterium]
MKKAVICLVSLVLLASLSLAAVDLDREFELKVRDNTHFTFGLGLAGNPFLGAVIKDGFGYPKGEMGYTNWAGFGYTWIYGTPSENELKDAFLSIKNEYGEANILSTQLSSLIRQKIDKNVLNYFTFGTVLFIYPLNVEYGWMFLAGDNLRFRVGFGLPLLFAFGFNVDF